VSGRSNVCPGGSAGGGRSCTVASFCRETPRRAATETKRGAARREKAWVLRAPLVFVAADLRFRDENSQGFFALAFEKRFFDRFDPGRRFRTYLRACLDGFVANERKSAHRLKRGGGAEHVSLDFARAEAGAEARQLLGIDSS
jgi:hypothetical protein